MSIENNIVFNGKNESNKLDSTTATTTTSTIDNVEFEKPIENPFKDSFNGERDFNKDKYQLPKYYFPKRFIFIILGFATLFVGYIIRITISVCSIEMQKQYGWSNIFKGVVLASFSMGYVFSQLFTQKICENIGAKRTLFIGLTISILTTFLVPITAQFGPILIIIRIICGFSQGVAFPTISYLIPKYFPLCQISRSAGIIWSGVYVGTIFSDFVSPILLKYVVWNDIFYIFGGICLIWSFFWFILIKDDPKDLKGIHQNELEFINYGKTININLESNQKEMVSQHVTSSPSNEKDIASNISSENEINSSYSSNNSIEKEFSYFEVVKVLLKSRGMLTILYVNITCSWAYSLLLLWYPSWLSKQLNENSSLKFAFFNALPFILCFIISNVFGLISDKLLNQYNIKKIYLRKIFGCATYLIPGICLFIVAYAPIGIEGKIAFMTISIAANGFTSSGSNLCTLDLSKKYSGVSMGLANFSLAIPNIIGPLLGGVLLSAFNNDWNPIFTISASCYLAGALVWIIFLKVDLVI